MSSLKKTIRSDRKAALLMFIVGIIFFCMSSIRTFNKISAKSWIQTEANVLDIDAYQQSGKSRKWCIRMRYFFNVNGKEYVSNRISVSLISETGCDTNPENVFSKIENIKNSRRIAIYYDKNDPSRSAYFLDEIDILDIFVMSVGLIFMGTALFYIRKKS